PAASKLLASRARRKVQQVPRPTGTPRQRREVVDAFLTAAHEGDFAALLRLLDPDVTWHRRTPRGSHVTIGADEVLAEVRRGDPARLSHRSLPGCGAGGTGLPGRGMSLGAVARRAEES